MSGGGSEEGASLEYTPTWIVAVVCSVIVAISLAAERLLHYLGQVLKRKNQKPLYEALQKVKEELMLLGFISLLLTVSQNAISKICVPKSLMDNLLPCKLSEAEEAKGHGGESASTSHHLGVATITGVFRRLLAEEASGEQIGYCARKVISDEKNYNFHFN